MYPTSAACLHACVPACVEGEALYFITQVSLIFPKCNFMNVNRPFLPILQEATPLAFIKINLGSASSNWLFRYFSPSFPSGWAHMLLPGVHLSLISVCRIITNIATSVSLNVRRYCCADGLIPLRDDFPEFFSSDESIPVRISCDHTQKHILA